ncbi:MULTISPECIES: hypothetical protein [unclassified Mesorhizobium]|uniref:hypothetical protein n=1 Tax=unclassified Mesorhizobium TaxID=325217 RepID=UPI000FCC8190|nr:MULTISPECIES: hypothetical protein [unclassified Mesorhizobium]TGP27957.1 hypothetical protein EN875_032885 [Mesorhizobium sp. M2D.F.Ca.ET.232.01.1.1]TGQ25547.1 hypothetical protein EN863_057095 [Mesorhizobium sp. M00.F.Ca.ET.220.01.1.1]TGT97837.1 hypothetical protein EN806_48520 [bacterium M00.F.Ca.ET.163.01.1.1]
MSKTTNPYAIVTKDDRVIDDIDYINAADHVANYGAAFVSYDAAMTAIAAAREEQRKQKTVDARTLA